MPKEKKDIAKVYKKLKETVEGVREHAGGEDKIANYLRETYNELKARLGVIEIYLKTKGENMLTYEIKEMNLELMYDQSQRIFIATYKGVPHEKMTSDLHDFARDADFFNPKKRASPEDIIESFAKIVKLGMTKKL